MRLANFMFLRREKTWKRQKATPLLTTSSTNLQHRPHVDYKHSPSPDRRTDHNPLGGESTQRMNSLEAKVVILGAQGAGKTSLVVRFVENNFHRNLQSTIGASFLVKKV